MFKCKRSLFCLLTAQDAGLDALAAVISRQKMMGQEIGNELDEQNGKFEFLHVSVHIRHQKIPDTLHAPQWESNHTCLFCSGTTCLM